MHFTSTYFYRNLTIISLQLPLFTSYNVKHCFVATLIMLCAISQGWAQCNPLTTLYAEDNGQDGIMFDITAAVDVTITGFDFNMGATSPYDMEIYYKAGTHVGFEANAGAWTLAGSAANVVGAGLDVPTSIPIALSVAIPAGQTYAFYITDTGTAANLDYTNGTSVGAVAAADANITIYEGTGKNYPFDDDYPARIPNTTVYYECCPEPLLTITENSCSGMADGEISAEAQGTAPWIYQISDITGVIATSPPTNGPYVFSTLIEGQYVVTTTDANGCTAQATAEITPLAPMLLHTSVTDNVCYGGVAGQIELTVSGGTNPIDIGWTDSFGNVMQTDLQTTGSATLANLPAGTYMVAAQDQVGCMASTSVSVLEPLVPLQLTVTATDLRCFQSADGEIAVAQNGIPPFTFELVDVVGALVDTDSSATAHTFQNLAAGTYFVTAADSNGCTATQEVTLTEPNVLEVEVAQSPVLCYNQNQGVATITSILGGTTPYAQTTWNDPQLQVGNTATNLFAGTYTATVSDANGCSLEVEFEFENPTPLTLEPIYFTDTCGQGKGAAMVHASLGTPPYAYYWKPNGETTQILPNLYQGTYEVTVTDANGCKDSTSVEVYDDIAYPHAAFDYRIEGDNLLTQEVQFINHSLGTTQWTWNFGNGASSNAEDPRYHYDQSGDYLVQLLASNGYCTDTAYQYVSMAPMVVIYIPNSFTPGINNRNDFFYPQGEGIELESYDMFIYDRWGKLVWQTGNYRKKWDGTNVFSKKEVAMGTYYYMIKFREYAALDRHVYTGYVNVIRD